MAWRQRQTQDGIATSAVAEIERQLPETGASKSVARVVVRKATKTAATHHDPGRAGLMGLGGCFATYLLEDGIDVRITQTLLGHAKLETTVYYTQVATRVLRNVTSPFARPATAAKEARTSSG